MTKTPSPLPECWQRIAFADQAVYLNPEKPDWLVAGAEADLLLQQPAPADPAAGLARALLLNQMEGGENSRYKGRAAHLALNGLRECWFHLTSRCNLACTHCLFASSPESSDSLDPALLQKGLAEARALGCRLFYFTGGEPFVYQGFSKIVSQLLEDQDIHVVILTNGLLLDKHLDSLNTLPRDRIHLQISLDGLAEHHDQLRGKGNFQRLMAVLDNLHKNHFATTLSVAVNRVNFNDLADITSLAARKKISNLHFLWHFVRGNGSAAQFVSAAEIFPELIKAQAVAAAHGLTIDNIETVRSQVFSSPGTRFDLSNAGWESLAVGSDGNIYPSPALVGITELAAGNLAAGLEPVWRDSPIMKRIRNSTLLDSAAASHRPLRFLTGGGDIDHSYLHGGQFVGHDPYQELYESIALWLMTSQAARYPLRNPAEISLRMGDSRHDCPDGGREVSLTHCNCVVSISGNDGHQQVREFYGQAARRTNSDIANPFGPDSGSLTFIPTKSKSRSYGCGSPVTEALPRPGETLVDLGSGSGVECFIAAEKVGPKGRVFGIDMTEDMLILARESQKEVAGKLGYDNLEFRHGYLEKITLEDNIADAVISNCVINLSPDKRGTFHEIFRILKPGGRLVVSDIVTDRQIPVSIRNNQQFRGECLGGALQQEQLLAMLRAAGFTGTELLRRFPYRQEDGTRFYSLTFRCRKPEDGEEISVIYRGPLEAVMTGSGILLYKGRKTMLNRDLAAQLDQSLFVLGADGEIANLPKGLALCCGSAPGSNNPEPVETCCNGTTLKLKQITEG